MYTIEVDNPRGLIVVEILGFWSVATVDGFMRELGAAIGSLGGRVGEHAIVLGFDEAEVAPAAVIDRFRHLIVHAPTRARRIAYHATSALKRLQVQRIAAERDGAMVFATRREAVAWALDK